MVSIGINLEQHVRASLLRFHTTRPTMGGLEMHLAVMHKGVTDYQPEPVIVNPCVRLISGDNTGEANQIVVRLIDLIEFHRIAADDLADQRRCVTTGPCCAWACPARP